MIGQRKISITEQKPSKFATQKNGYEVISNDGKTKIHLNRITVMDGSMESVFYSTIMWIKEDNGWIEVNNVHNYRTKEEFLKAIGESEEFTQAMEEYKFNIKDNEL